MSNLFRKKCNVCKTERTAADNGMKFECNRTDDNVKSNKEFLPAPLAHYCCCCALHVGWSKFDASACTNCKERHAKRLDAQHPHEIHDSPERFNDLPKSASLSAPNTSSRGGTDMVAGKEEGEDVYVKIGWCDEGARDEEEAEARAGRLALVEQECDALRAAAIQQATAEALEHVARILADAQNSARQQAAEERSALLCQAREEAAEIVEQGKMAAKQEIERVLSEADKILNHAALEAAGMVEEARTSVAPAGAWVEIGLTGCGGWHFGSVYRADHIQGLGNGAPMAVKRLDPSSMQGQGEFLQELQVLGACRHEHLLPVLGFAADVHVASDAVCLVSPLMVGGNLEDRLLMSHGNLEAQQRLQLLASTPLPPNTHASPAPARGVAYS
eukprot:CAMPEP_0173128930 /NCGR_PEP_ID=MMETSP1102-20130122/58853_1 /TAXON_ID=49646 /ORGANISM="Geminigera sp., Strain Caron Lab Isolate" /LENGTH=387 /DNA_ID=CAMNT_0014039179 /DNA_START=123 /DNA_END=1283 /DNA_ORIENTATION=-